MQMDSGCQKNLIFSDEKWFSLKPHPNRKNDEDNSGTQSCGGELCWRNIEGNSKHCGMLLTTSSSGPKCVINKMEDILNT